MMIKLYEDKKLVDIWLTRAERDDQELRERLKPLYAKYHAMKYQVTVFESGDGDLRESVLGLIEFNRKRLRELEQQKDKKAQNKVRQKAVGIDR